MKGFKKIDLYYFTGTGNAEAAARWFAETSEESELPVSLFNLAKIKRRNINRPDPDTLIGFSGPTHGFNYPPILFHFLLKFPRANGNYVFLMNTRAGMKLGRFFVQGLSGMAMYFSALILFLKGYKIAGMRPVDLPSTWISIHPGIREKVYTSIIEHRKKQVHKFAKAVLSRKRIYRGLWSLPIDIAITPISILYYLIGRFFLAKTFIASSACTDCGLCESSCPVNAIKIIDTRRFWTYKCESCMRCMNLCPVRAIESPHGFIAIVIFLLSGVVLVKISETFHLHRFFDENLPDFLSGFVAFAVDNIILVFMIFIAYLIMHFLMRFRFFERLFVLTSFTHLGFWRRYKPKWNKWLNKN